jgi:hypothetical protein
LTIDQHLAAMLTCSVKDKPAGPDADWLILNANMQINTHYNLPEKQQIKRWM